MPRSPQSPGAKRAGAAAKRAVAGRAGSVPAWRVTVSVDPAKSVDVDDVLAELGRILGRAHGRRAAGPQPAPAPGAETPGGT